MKTVRQQLKIIRRAVQFDLIQQRFRHLLIGISLSTEKRVDLLTMTE